MDLGSAAGICAKGIPWYLACSLFVSSISLSVACLSPHGALDNKELDVMKAPFLDTLVQIHSQHQENPKFYEDTTSIIQVFGDLWWSMKTYWCLSCTLDVYRFGAPASMSIVVSKAELCVYEVHHRYVGRFIVFRPKVFLKL
jgi:hypothetical protein